MDMTKANFVWLYNFYWAAKSHLSHQFVKPLEKTANSAKKLYLKQQQEDSTNGTIS